MDKPTHSNKSPMKRVLSALKKPGNKGLTTIQLRNICESNNHIPEENTQEYINEKS